MEKKKKNREEEMSECCAPPYQLPPLDGGPPPPPNPPVNSIYPALPSAPDRDSESGSGPNSPAVTRRITRSQLRGGGQDSTQLFPLKEVPMGMIPNPNAGQVGQPAQIPGVGYIASPLNSGDVRDFKRRRGIS